MITPPGPARRPRRPGRTRRQQARGHGLCLRQRQGRETFVPGICLYARGRDYTAPDGKNYCFPAATNAEVMEDAFNAAWCAKEFPDFPQRLCVKANACPLLGDTQQPC
ncbi:hypothetical protein PG996_007397 [Apiospora saccharicola]|uniref:Uncharacterized protein n=1 Tax=Apiospora saccharicola TaxID=335842 RepID=A0ABR1VDH0_9PEZI